MDDPVPDEDPSPAVIEYDAHGQPGSFTAKVMSPHNSLHQVSGFKSADDAQTWVREATLLIGKFTT